MMIVSIQDKESSCQLIKHFQYTGWPTNSVPGSATELLDIREQVEKWQRNTDDQPIIVHCRLTNIVQSHWAYKNDLQS